MLGCYVERKKPLPERNKFALCVFKTAVEIRVNDLMPWTYSSVLNIYT